MITPWIPVYIKEMRQFKRSGGLVGAAVFAAIVWVIFFWNVFSSREGALSERTMGGVWAFCMMVFFLGGVIMAFLSATRLSRESGNPALDPALTTPLPPYAIIGGKLLAFLTMLMFIYIPVFPVLYLTYPESYDKFGLFQALVLAFLEITAVCLFMYLVRPRGGFRKSSNVAGIIMIVVLMPSIITLLIIGLNGKWLSADGFYAATIGLMALIVLFFVAAFKLMSPPSHDRTFAVKTLLVFYCFALVPLLAVLFGLNSRQCLTLWSIFVEALALFIFPFMAITEPLRLSHRSAAAAKSNWFYNAAFPLQGTAAGSLAASLLCFGAALALDPERRNIFYFALMKPIETVEYFNVEWRVWIYAQTFFYFSLVVFIRWRLRRNMNAWSPFKLAAAVMAPGALLASFSIFSDIPWLRYFSPFPYMYGDSPFSMAFCCFWGAAGLVLAVPVFAYRFNAGES